MLQHTASDPASQPAAVRLSLRQSCRIYVQKAKRWLARSRPQPEPFGIRTFIEESLAGTTGSVEYLSGWKAMQAYAYQTVEPPHQRIVRFRPTPLAFEKDRSVANLLGSRAIPVPSVIEIGRYDSDFFYGVSVRAAGTNLKLAPASHVESTTDRLAQVLFLIHSHPIPEGTKYGRWAPGRSGSADSWRAYLAARIGRQGKGSRKLLKARVRDRLLREIDSNLAHVSEQASLLHGDFSLDNLVGTDGELTAVIDWEKSMYGDHLYDVAYFDFWHPDIQLPSHCRAHYEKHDFDLKKSEARLACYQALIGLTSLTTFMASGSQTGYRWTVGRLRQLFGIQG